MGEVGEQDVGLLDREAHAAKGFPVIPNLGMIVPKMGTKSSNAPATMADALFPRVRQRVLAILFGNPDRTFFASELMALAQSGRGAVHRELTDLAAAGLLTVTSQGNQKHYRANQSAPVFAELRSLVLKTFGLADVLRDALAPLTGKIDAAFVFGSVAKHQDTASSDIDVMIISDSLGYADAFAALEPAAVNLGRPVNPTVYTNAQLSKRARQDNAFVQRVLEQPKIWLIGQEEDLLAHGA